VIHLAGRAQPFKRYNRGSRIQIADEEFKSGMDYSTVPLSDGYVKQMVNYDLAGVYQDRLTPRPGFRQYAADLYAGATAYNTDMLLIDGKGCAEEDGETYNQIITGQVTDAKLADTNLYLGTGEVNTGSNDVLTRADLQTGGDKILYNKPTSASIHDVAVTELDNVAQHVGTFAFNDDYYYFKDSGVLARTNFNSGAYESVDVTVQPINPKEAVMWGYNMLSTTPYAFTNTLAPGNIVMHGLVPYKQGTSDIELTPEINQDLTLEVFYTVGTGLVYDFVIEWREVSSSAWTEISKQTITFATALPLKADVSFPTKDVLVRVSAYPTGAPNPDQVMTVGLAVNKEDYQEHNNTDLVNYSLHTATGMSYWRKRLVVWGVKEDPTVLFMSEVNNPEYFPYPNNIDLMEEPVIHAVPLGDDLLVFTTTRLYIVQLSADGLSWTKKVIQKDLYIKTWDTHLIQPIKNMLFFKSGNYYYLVVPSKASSTGLSVAPISKPVEKLFDNFQEHIVETLLKVYGHTEAVELIHYYNYLDFEDIHNVYVLKTISGLYINLGVLYNVNSRTWKEYAYESQHIVKPFQKDATKKGIFMTLFDFNSKPSVQYLQYVSTTAKDFYLPDGITVLEEAEAAFTALHTFKNYQMLDSGLREHESDFKKRYREVQVKFNNISQLSLNFNTKFSIDGGTRRNYERYILNHNIDTEDPNYGLITMVRELIDPSVLPGAAVLATDVNDTAAWMLDQSTLPEVYLWKVRIKVSGKGYTPQFVLVSYNEEQYEIMNISFVYRPLYSR
jgi:hypothetical protein